MSRGQSLCSSPAPSPRLNSRKFRRDRLCPYAEGVHSSPKDGLKIRQICSEGAVRSMQRPDKLALAPSRRHSVGTDSSKSSECDCASYDFADWNPQGSAVRSAQFCSRHNDDTTSTPNVANAQRRSTCQSNRFLRRRSLRLLSDCSSDSAIGEDMSSTNDSPCASSGDPTAMDTPDLAKDFNFLAMNSPLGEEFVVSGLGINGRTKSLSCVRSKPIAFECPVAETTSSAADSPEEPVAADLEATANATIIAEALATAEPTAATTSEMSPTATRTDVAGDRLRRSPLDNASGGRGSDLSRDVANTHQAAPRYHRSASLPARATARRLFGDTTPSATSLPACSPVNGSFSDCTLVSSKVGSPLLLSCTSPHQQLHFGESPMCITPFGAGSQQRDVSSARRFVPGCQISQGFQSPMPGLSSLLSAPLLSTPNHCRSKSSERFGGTLHASPFHASDSQVDKIASSQRDHAGSSPRSVPVKGFSDPRMISIYLQQSLSTNSLLSNEGVDCASLPSRWPNSLADEDSCSEDNELTRAGRFDLNDTPTMSSVKRCHSTMSPDNTRISQKQKNPEPHKRHCCLRENHCQSTLSPFVLKPNSKHMLSTSSPQINAAYGILSPGQKAADLVGDFTRSHSLPCTSEGNTRGVNRISCETLAKALNGDIELPGKLVIIDCRYPYEYNGGHIQGAINIDTAEEITAKLISAAAIDEVKQYAAQGKAVVLVFHCEFSVKRSVALFKHLRKKDREIHLENYPCLYYPEMYLLSGGYKEFYDNCKALCDPPHYVSMNDKKFSGELTRFSRAKSYSGLKAGVPRLRHRNSLKF